MGLHRARGSATIDQNVVFLFKQERAYSDV